MTVEFDRTAHCQYNHQRLTEFQRILTEQFWLCFDRTTIPTEHLRKLGFDRTVNWKMFCQKNALWSYAELITGGGWYLPCILPVANCH